APLRPNDQGFEESLVIKGGGIGQPSDPLGGNHYNDPILQHNCQAQRYQGYCSDIFTDAAIKFINKHRSDPFFPYLAFTCPQEPLEAPELELAAYNGMNLPPSEFPQLGQPIPPAFAASTDTIARVYAMVSNIDHNIGKILKALDKNRLAENTMVVFLTDN